MRKYYRGTFVLGCGSPSDDTETDVTPLVDPPVPEARQVTAALQQFTGTIQQRPPDYSAVKVAGRRAYRLARQGKPVRLAPREVTVHHLNLVRYEYPHLVLDICCSAGTYVRSLGRDLAAALGTAAVMSELTRTAIGEFRLADAVALEDLGTHNVLQHLLPAGLAVAELVRLDLTASEVQDVINGRRIERDDLPVPRDEEIAGFDTSGQLLAILSPREKGILSPVRVFPPVVTQ
jgi:tRNA pseudouridine55 synthase